MISLCPFSPNISKKLTHFWYIPTDRGLMWFQRLLYCFAILTGNDMRPSRDIDKDSSFAFHWIVRIVRNFFFVTKGVRKWLAISFNDGIVPPPPIKKRLNGSGGQLHRNGRFTIRRSSTPKLPDSAKGVFSNGSLKHSPIEHRYKEVSDGYKLSTAIREHQSPNVYDSSDFLGHSSFSFKLLMQSLRQSFTGYIDDPEIEDVSQRFEKILQRGNYQEEEIQEHEKANSAEIPQHLSSSSTSQTVDSAFSESEHARRIDMVSESVIEDAKRTAQLLRRMRGCNSSTDESTDKKPLEPFPDPPMFDSIEEAHKSY